MDAKQNLQNRVRGFLLGGAIGDALGAPVEFVPLAAIREQFGPEGIVDLAPAFGRRGTITDDTQMTLFTAEGLMRALVREQAKGICSVPAVVGHAYLRWMATQGVASSLSIGKDGWLWAVEGLHHRRSPGKTCLHALGAATHFPAERARNESKGAGAIARVAPVVCITNNGRQESTDSVFRMAKSISWLTHGHPSGYLSAAAFAVILHAVLWDHPLATGIERARAALNREEGAGETLKAIARAVACIEEGLPPHRALPAIGPGWVGEEALAIALYCALAESDFAAATRMAVNHDGNSPTTGSLVGQLLGARNGEASLPADWLRELDLRETIRQVADDLASFLTWNLDPDGDDGGQADRIWERYPGW